MHGSTYRYMGWNAALVGVNNGNTGTFAINIFINSATGKAVVQIIGGRGAFNQIKNRMCLQHRLVEIFTNNLAILCFNWRVILLHMQFL